MTNNRKVEYFGRRKGHKQNPWHCMRTGLRGFGRAMCGYWECSENLEIREKSALPAGARFCKKCEKKSLGKTDCGV